VEAASPIDAVEVTAAELAAMVGAHTVRFLISDLSDRAVVRFGELAPGWLRFSSRALRKLRR
jgi:hypothetical protein